MIKCQICGGQPIRAVEIYMECKVESTSTHITFKKKRVKKIYVLSISLCLFQYNQSKQKLNISGHKKSYFVTS